MSLRNVRALTNTLLMAQLRSRGQTSYLHWYRKPSGLLKINIAVLIVLFAVSYELVSQIPSSFLAENEAIIIQGLSIVPIVTFSFVILYSILFVIGETSQFTTTEVVNYMPISSTEYVLASTLSTVLMYFFILTAITGITLAIALPLGLLSVWAVSIVFSLFFMLVGGFVGEIIRALINRVSSSFSKRGGRSAIISRAIAIILVLVSVQLFFNPNILYAVLQYFAPQFQSFWFVPLLWPSLAVQSLVTSNLSTTLLFAALTATLGLVLMLLSVFLRSRYWAPLPVTIKLGSSKVGKYSGPGILGMLGFSQVESAIILKDTRSLFRRKEMVRYLSLPFIIVVVFFLDVFAVNGSVAASDLFFPSAFICILGAGMFGLYVSMTSFGQEGKAIWNLYSAPIDPRSLLMAKIAMPLLVSLVPAVVLPIVFSLVSGLGGFLALSLLIITILITSIAVLVGAFIGPKYMDLEEKPRNAFVTGTGIIFGMIFMTAVGFACIAPAAFYVIFRDFAIQIGFIKYYALLASVLISLAAILVLFRLALSGVKEITKELPLE